MKIYCEHCGNEMRKQNSTIMTLLIFGMINIMLGVVVALIIPPVGLVFMGLWFILLTVVIVFVLPIQLIVRAIKGPQPDKIINYRCTNSKCRRMARYYYDDIN